MAKRILLLLLIPGLGCGCALKTGGGLWQIDDVAVDREPDGDDTTVDVPDSADPDDGAGDPMQDPDMIDPVLEDIVTDMELEDGLLCDPGSSWCVDEYTLAICDAGGTDFSVEPCSLGCSDAPSPRCLAFMPSNVADGSLLCVPGTTDFAHAAGIRYVHVNTETGAIRSWDSGWNFLGMLRDEGPGLIAGIQFTVVPQTHGGPDLAVFSVTSMTLHADMDLYATGSNALAFFSCGAVTVAGVLQAGADVYSDVGFQPGPGGSGSGDGDGMGGAGISSTSNVSGGGGGGGFGGAGGSGNGASSSGGTGGAFYGNEILVPLLGGSGGGKGADNSGTYGDGGPGGGALQVSAASSITVLANGVVESNGERGLGGSLAGGGGGGGGGSGGGVLLEAPAITVEAGGIIAANGGGGGSGALYPSYSGNNGQRGRWSLEPAAGGESPTGGACAGASGNSASSIDGAALACSDTNGGGGGGSAGRIRLNALTLEVAGDTLSPALTASPTTTTTGPLDLR
jgi:hypothetical protein